jgi:hypothetical protein
VYSPLKLCVLSLYVLAQIPLCTSVTAQSPPKRQTSSTREKKAATDRPDWDKLIGDLNAILLNEVLANDEKYRGYGFTVELSTGKLWWTRVIDGICKNYLWALGSGGARLSELDADSIGVEKTDGVDHIVVKCKKAESGEPENCWQHWFAPKCAFVRDFEMVPVPTTIDLFQRSTNVTDSSNQMHSIPWNYGGKTSGVGIRTTEDKVSIARAIAQLKLVIATAEKSPPGPK